LIGTALEIKSTTAPHGLLTTLDGVSRTRGRRDHSEYTELFQIAGELCGVPGAEKENWKSVVGAWRLPASGVVCGWSAARGAEILHKADRAILEDEWRTR
jgi:hypothetical protein